MKDIDPNKPIRRRQALKNDSIPIFILYTVYHLLHDYMPH